MWKIIAIFLLLCTCWSTVTAQSWRQIIESGEYFWGEGSDTTMTGADSQAMVMLLRSVKSQVKFKSEAKNERIESSGNVISDNNIFAATIEISAEGSIEETIPYIFENGPEIYHVGRAIKKTDLNKIYTGRRNKIIGYIEAAERALDKGKIDDALRSYYWAYMLTKSMRLAAREEYGGHTLLTWLPQRIEEILSDVKVYVTPVSQEEADICFTYRDAPVSSINYTYSDGGNWTDMCTATDGKDHMFFCLTRHMNPMAFV